MRLQLLKPADYYSIPLVSNSGLGNLKSMIFGETSKFNVSRGTLRKGQLVHMAIYEYQEFINSPEFLAAAVSGTVSTNVSSAQRALISEVITLAESARKTPVIKHFLESPKAVFEEEIFTLINGVPFKMKLDALIVGEGIHDSKTTATTSKSAFVSKFGEFGYWRQAAAYMRGTGEKNFYFTGISKAKPGITFLVNVKDYPVEMAAANEELDGLLEEYIKIYPNYIEQALALFKPLSPCNY